MFTYRELTLDEWIEQGQANGTITNMLTVIWAYRIDEADARRWIASLVCREISEREVLARAQWNPRLPHQHNEINWCSRRYTPWQRLH